MFSNQTISLTVLYSNEAEFTTALTCFQAVLFSLFVKPLLMAPKKVWLVLLPRR
jgi:hypothetical protein